MRVKKSLKIYFSNLLLIILLFSILFLLLSSGCDTFYGIKDNVASILNRENEEKMAVKVVEDFFESIINYDFEKAYMFIYKTENNNHNLEDFKAEFKNVTKIIKIQAKYVEVKNNIAIVGVDIIDTYDGDEKIYKDIEVSLVKDSNGDWKINFW